MSKTKRTFTAEEKESKHIVPIEKAKRINITSIFIFNK